MAQRRPLTSHPVFVPLVALWFAALLGLIVVVLPQPALDRAFTAAGAGALLPPSDAGRAIAAAGAALAGALLGFALAWPLARRGRRDPRPIYAEPELPIEDPVSDAPIRRRPLSVREELAEEMPGEWPAAAPAEMSASSAESDAAIIEPVAESAPPKPPVAEAEEGFMILTPQPVHPQRQAPDLDALLSQFDSALAAFRSDDEDRPVQRPGGTDPVHAFVARQTGAPARGLAPSPLGGAMPDHQAELRAALDKLARAHRKD